jgi:hypothetical protein
MEDRVILRALESAGHIKIKIHRHKSPFTDNQISGARNIMA